MEMVGQKTSNYKYFFHFYFPPLFSAVKDKLAGSPSPNLTLLKIKHGFQCTDLHPGLLTRANHTDGFGILSGQ